MLLFPPFHPIHGLAQIDSQNLFPFERPAPRGFSPLQNSKKNCLAHRSHLGGRHRRDMQFSSVRAFQRLGVHFVRYFCFMRFKKILSHLALFCPASVLIGLTESARSCVGVAPGGGQLLFQYFARITFKSIAQKSPAYSLKTFLKYPFNSRTKSSPPSNSFSEVMSS